MYMFPLCSITADVTAELKDANEIIAAICQVGGYIFHVSCKYFMYSV